MSVIYEQRVGIDAFLLSWPTIDSIDVLVPFAGDRKPGEEAWCKPPPALVTELVIYG
jgi:hypothetical protein